MTRHEEVLKRAIISYYTQMNFSQEYHAKRVRMIRGITVTVSKEDYISFCMMLGYKDLIPYAKEYIVNSKDLGLELEKIPPIDWFKPGKIRRA